MPIQRESRKEKLRKKRLFTEITAIVIMLAIAFSTVSVYGAQLKRPVITAKSGLVLDGTTGKIL